MRKIAIWGVLALMALALAAVPALAVTNFENGPSGAHYRKGFSEPTCTPSPALRSPVPERKSPGWAT